MGPAAHWLSGTSAARATTGTRIRVVGVGEGVGGQDSRDVVEKKERKERLEM